MPCPPRRCCPRAGAATSTTSKKGRQRDHHSLPHIRKILSTQQRHPRGGPPPPRRGFLWKESPRSHRWYRREGRRQGSASPLLMATRILSLYPWIPERIPNGILRRWRFSDQLENIKNQINRKPNEPWPPASAHFSNVNHIHSNSSTNVQPFGFRVFMIMLTEKSMQTKRTNDPHWATAPFENFENG